MLIATCPHGMRARSFRAQRGLSLVEMMVGVALGLVLAVWAISLFVNTLGNNRKLDAERRLNQGLGIAADLIARDLRRAGYWGDSIAGTVTSSTGSTTTANAYSNVSYDSTSNTIQYGYATDTDDTESSTEQYGFRLNSGVIEMQLASGGTWQPVTDPNLMTVTAMSITPTTASIDLSAACSSTCSGASCPKLYVRSYAVVLQARYASDSSVTRELDTDVRVRNDAVGGSCP